ncbi:MAG: hypothetical protein ACQUHE_04610 [Bacteroidia bacterium]
MKNFLVTSTIICTLLINGCKKDESDKSELLGKWLLTEQLADPGDGSGKYQKVTGENKTVTFNQSGEVTGEVFTAPAQYKVLDSVRVEITTKTNNQSIVYRYKATSKELILNAPCIEPCGLKFKRQ